MAEAEPKAIPIEGSNPQPGFFESVREDSIWREFPTYSPPSSRAKDILDAFTNATDGILKDQSPQKRWDSYFEGNIQAPIDQAIDSTVNNYFNTFNANLGGIEAKLDALLAALKSQAAKAEADISNQIRQIIQIGERQINTNAAPILGKLEAITAGAMPFSALDDALVTALYTSIPWGLEFIQSERLSQGTKLLGNIAKATISAPSSIVDGIGDALGELGRGLLNGIAALLSRIEATLIDPIAALLAAILAEIRKVPMRAANALWDSLLLDQDTQPTS